MKLVLVFSLFLFTGCATDIHITTPGFFRTTRPAVINTSQTAVIYYPYIATRWVDGEMHNYIEWESRPISYEVLNYRLRKGSVYWDSYDQCYKARTNFNLNNYRVRPVPRYMPPNTRHIPNRVDDSRKRGRRR